MAEPLFVLTFILANAALVAVLYHVLYGIITGKWQ